MMLHLKYWLGCGLLLLSLSTTWGQGLLNFQERSSLDREQLRFLRPIEEDPTTASLAISSINFETLRSGTFSLNLPNGRSYQVVRLEEDSLDSKRQFFLGNVIGEEGQVHLIQKGDLLTGHLELGTSLYSIKPLTRGKHALIEIDQAAFDPCSTGARQKAPSARDQASPEDVRQQLPREWLNEGEEPAGRSAGDCRVRVLVAYTPAVNAALADPLSTINLAIQLTNTGYWRSGIGHRLELARAYETSYTEHPSQSTNLNRFTSNGDGFMDEVHSERARWRADMCHLLTVNGSGIAWVSHSFGSTFAVTNHTYINGYTFGHEIGHNHRANHDPTAYSGSSNYRGYGHPSGYFRTVMAYGSACGSGSCSRVNEFSGPSNYYYHAPTASWYVTGTATQNNVAAHNNSGPTIANHYSSYTNAYYTSTTVGNDEAIHAAASQTIQNNPSLPHFVYLSGSEGSFKASERVTLIPGFRARAGSSFRAYLENCTPMRTAGDQEVAHGGTETGSTEQIASTMQTEFGLNVFPNPVRGQATLQVDLPKASTVYIYLRNAIGQLVKPVINGEAYDAGRHELSLDVSQLPAGVYMLLLKTPEEQKSKKIVVSN